MSRHESVWMATGDASAWPLLTTDERADVVVVGGGITGLTTAVLLQRAGISVVVLEARTVAAGTTGATTGKVTSQHGLKYADLVTHHGEEKARLYARANEDAIALVARFAGEMGEDAQFRRTPAYTYTCDPARRDDLVAEVETARRLGLPASLVDDIELGFPVEAAVRFDEQAHIHAQRYCAGLAQLLTGAGGRLYEGTRAVAVDDGRDGVTVRTERGASVRADSVVVATLLPFVDRGGFFARAFPSRAYGVAAHVAGAPPEGMYISVESPVRSVRPWDDDGRPGVIVAGENHHTGQGGDTRHHWGELERWARSVFEVESFEYRWSAQDYMPADGVPYAGRSPLSKHIYVATGFLKWGLTNGTAAAAVLAELLQGRDAPELRLFDPARIGGASAVRKLVQENAGVARTLVQDRVRRLRARSVAHLAPGEGGMVEVDGRAVGAYRDPQGAVHAVGITCTHLGCTLRWNGGERSWDCPCHGSRFSYEGEVLDGPAVERLPVVEVELDT